MSTIDNDGLGWDMLTRRATGKVKEIIPADEPTTPGILYVGVATLTGSVLGRNRTPMPVSALYAPR